MYARIWVSREAPYMELVDNCFRFGAGRNISGPIELDSMPGQHSQRRFSGIVAGRRGQLAVKLWREENTLRIGIEQKFLRIDDVKFRNSLPRDRVSIITSTAHFIEVTSTVPDSSRLIADEIEWECEHRICQFVGGIEQQSDALRVLRIHCKIKRLLLFDPGCAEWQ